MMLRGDYYELTILNDISKGPSLKLNNKSLEIIIFEQLQEYPYIVEISAFKERNKKTILYSAIGSLSILTAHFNLDYNGPLEPLKIFWDRKYLIKDTKVEHACSPERMLERHLERTANKYLYTKEKIVDNAREAYSKLINAMSLD